MVSSLFDPVVDLAFTTAKKRKSIAPARLVPFLSFKTMPTKAKETIIEVLEEDEVFRKRVAKQASEAKHGRFAHSYLARPKGWETFVSQMIEMDEEPLGDPDGDDRPKGEAGGAGNAEAKSAGTTDVEAANAESAVAAELAVELSATCLLYTSPSPRDQRGSRMPSSA